MLVSRLDAGESSGYWWVVWILVGRLDAGESSDSSLGCAPTIHAVRYEVGRTCTVAII